MELTTCRCQVAYTILDYLCDNKCYPFKIELLLFILLIHYYIHTYIHIYIHTYKHTHIQVRISFIGILHYIVH